MAVHYWTQISVLIIIPLILQTIVTLQPSRCLLKARIDFVLEYVTRYKLTIATTTAAATIPAIAGV